MQELLVRFISLTRLPGLPIDEARRVNDEEAAAMFGPVEGVWRVEDVDIPGPGHPIRARLYRPSAAEHLPVLVYFHGGGWVVGSLDSHDGVTRFLANHGACIVFSIHCRLAPEHRFPAAVEDAWAAVEWVQLHATGIGGDGRRLAVAGDSGGGTLAAVVARRARDHGIALVLQLLVYPLVDCQTALGDGDGRWWVMQYLRSEEDALDPDASPLRAQDLRGVAPALALSCQGDPLVAQADAYCARLLDSGVDAEHVCYPGLIHGAYRMPAVLPGARRMLEDSASALRVAFGVTE